MAAGAIRYDRLVGPALAGRLDDLAALRQRVFRDWPYLYDGDAAAERRYLETYVRDPDAVIVAARTGDRAVGVATGVPLAGEPENVQAPLRAQGLAVESVFYFGESVLLPAWRGQGIGVAFFGHREAHARALGRFTHAVFCGVVRDLADPRRPPGYVPLDDFWRKRGYRPLDGARCFFSWREIGQTEESEKPMQFWIKALG
jgi:GNAT superfamily N-acetyltransferase